MLFRRRKENKMAEENKNKPEDDKKEDDKKEEAEDKTVQVQKNEKEVNKEEKKKEDNTAQQLSFLKADLEKSKAESESWKNKYYEAYADLANTRKYLEKDHETMVKYRSQGFVEKMLPALDSFEMAFMVEPTDPKIKNYCSGFKMILNQMTQALTDEGITTITPKIGDKFDVSKMHAIQTVDGDEDDLVASIYVKGYMLKDRLIRPAMVVVTKKKAEENKDTQTEEVKKDESKKDEKTA